MNLTDLTAELETRAANAPPADLPATAAMARLTGVRYRIRTRRRRQMGSAAGIAALGVAAVLLFPGMPQQRAEQVPASPATAEPTPSDPLAFASEVAGDPLVATDTGVMGQTELVLRYTPTDTNLAISFFCRIQTPDSPPRVSAGLITTMAVNGKEIEGGGCSRDAVPNQNTLTRGEAGADNRAGWADLGVIRGRESVFRLRVTWDRAGNHGAVRLGLGIYEPSGPRLSEGVDGFPKFYETGRHRYQLADYWTEKAGATVDGKPTTAVNRLYLDVPAGRHPVQVWLELKQSKAESKTRGFVELYVDGKRAGARYAAADSGFISLDDAKAHTIELRIDPGLRGTMALAYYVRVD